MLWRCVEFAQEVIGGLALLQLAGVNSGQPPQIYDWGGGAYTVCQIDHQPQAVPDPCFDKVGANWADWFMTAGGWQSRLTGVAGYTVKDGDVEGWIYAGDTRTPPPFVSFTQVCPPARPPTPAAPSTTVTPSGAGAANVTMAAPTTSTASPSPVMQALAPSLSPSVATVLASTGPERPPPPGSLTPWLLLGGAVIVLSGLGAFNLRRRGP